MSEKEIQCGRDFSLADHLNDRGQYKRAFNLMLKCAAAGYVPAQVSAGFFYDVGRGVGKDKTKALYWYRRAARRGDASAANNIGVIYRDAGKYSLARFWFGRAVNLGDDDANLHLAKLCLAYQRSSNSIRLAKSYLKKVLKSDFVTEDSQQ